MHHIKSGMTLLLFALLATVPVRAQGVPQRLVLDNGWALQSSAKVHASAESISTPGYGASGWIAAQVPATVVATQVKQGLLPDPFYGMNLRRFPGVGYPVGVNFSERAMPVNSPYAASWWYRTEFTLPQDYAGKTLWLGFKGINYKANVYLNGKLIADASQVIGAWRTYEFNVTPAIKPGKNVLALQVWAQTETDLGITFVDWNPSPPDKNMGLFREVYLTTSGPVAVRHATVISKLEAPAYDAAQLTVTALLKNASAHTVKGTLRGRIEQAEFSKPVELAPGEQQDVS
ncbi:MAG: glycosyl hydrolase 2 galactose-binding domain-containing protein, partial [Steroidobacteraceae bacterium]